MAVSLEQLDVIQSAELIGMHGEQSRVYITPEWSTFISKIEPFDSCDKLAFVPHAGFILASMIEVANVPLPINMIDAHISNVASITKIKHPNASPNPLIVEGVFDKTRKASALRSLEFGSANPIKYHFFRIGRGSAKSVLLMFCTDISSTDYGAIGLEQYHEKLGSTDSRIEADLSSFMHEYKRRKKIEDEKLERLKKSRWKNKKQRH